MSAPPLALLDPATAQLLLSPPVATSPGGSAARRCRTSAAAVAVESETAEVVVAIGATGAERGNGPGSYGACTLGGRIGNHSDVRSTPRDLLRSAITRGVSVKFSVCVMSPLTKSESIGVQGCGS